MKWNKWPQVKPPEPDMWGENYLCTVDNQQVVALRYCNDLVKGKQVIRWRYNGKISPWEPIAWMEFPKPYGG